MINRTLSRHFIFEHLNQDSYCRITEGICQDSHWFIKCVCVCVRVCWVCFQSMLKQLTRCWQLSCSLNAKTEISSVSQQGGHVSSAQFLVHTLTSVPTAEILDQMPAPKKKYYSKMVLLWFYNITAEENVNKIIMIMISYLLFFRAKMPK